MPTLTADQRYACTNTCQYCLTHPGHQQAAYDMGVSYGQNSYHPADVTVEIAYFERKIDAADADEMAFLVGIRDGLIKQTAVAA
jgi:hypothetical protein